MQEGQKKKFHLKIHGTHCASCEVLIERKFSSISGVQKVRVDHVTGKAEICCHENFLEEHNFHSIPNKFEALIKEHGYEVTHWDYQKHGESPHENSEKKNTKRDYVEIGAIFLILFGIYQYLKFFDFLPQGLGIGENMSYGFVFLIGLVAAVSSCLAVTGGLLLAVAAKYNERHPHLSNRQRFRPHFYFNIGRIIGYTIFGGAVGALGSILTFSSKASGVMTIVASLVMIILGFQLLHLFPWTKRFAPRMPKWISHKIHDLETSEQRQAPFILGAFTFFLPCGFTQALQLYVLSKGDMLSGALIMFVFSLGTLPALLSLSTISSFSKGAFQRYFLKFTGVIVLVLGFWNINNGFALTGNPLWLGKAKAEENNVNTNSKDGVRDPNVSLINGKQIVRMKVNGFDYSPSQFTVIEGIPVEWQIDGSGASGCAQVIVAPDLNITEYLPPSGIKTIAFTPEKLGKIYFSCSMGMTTPGASFNVVAADNAILNEKRNLPVPSETDDTKCNSEIMNCVPDQKVSMEVSRERGFYPNVFTVKKDIPVEFEIDDKVPLGGCMGTIVIPDYNVAKKLTLGTNTIKFTPTKLGDSIFTCSMGNPLGQFRVIN